MHINSLPKEKIGHEDAGVAKAPIVCQTYCFMTFTMANINYSDLEYIPLQAAKENKKKVTLKRSHLEMALGEHFPSEGHCSIFTPSSEDRDSQCRILTFGGARLREERTWQDGANITEFLLKADEDDVYIEASLCKTKGKL